jgi:hypothetical protein
MECKGENVRRLTDKEIRQINKHIPQATYIANKKCKYMRNNAKADALWVREYHKEMNRYAHSLGLRSI